MRHQTFLVCLVLLALLAPRMLYAESDGDKGDLTVSGTGATWAIDSDTITNAKLSNMVAGTVKGRATAGLGDPEDLTGTQVTSLLDTFTSSLKGLTPASGGGTANFLRADGTWAPPGGGSGSIADDAVTNPKLANMSTATIKGRATAGTGDPEDLTAGQVAAILDSQMATQAELNAFVPATATALAANPVPCSANQFVTDIAANGDLTCAAISDAMVPNNITLDNYQPLDADLTTLAGKTIVGTGTDVRMSTGAFPAETCVKVNAAGNFSSTGQSCGAGGGGLSKVIADAIDEASALTVGGLVYKIKFWGNPTDGVVQKTEPSQNISWALAEGFNAYWRDHLLAPIIRIEESTKTTYFSGPIVTAAGEAALITPIAAVGTKKVASIGSDGVPVLADDVQPLIVHGAPSAGSCVASNDILIDDTTTPPALYFCKVAGGNPMDVATLGNGYVMVGDGTHTASATGAEQLSLAGDPGGILSPLVTPGTPDTFKYTFSTQSANRVLKGPNTGSPAIPTFAALVEADLPATAVTQTSNSALTNKTLDAEGTGNTLTVVEKRSFRFVNCAGTTGTLQWDTLAALAPTATCTVGATNTDMMRGVADFPDLDGDYSLQRSDILLPSDWTGAIDVTLWWRSAVSANNVVWQVQTACRADGEVDEVAWNTASTVTDTAKAVAGQLNTATITGLTTTGCAAGEIMHLRILRNRTHASDNITGVISLTAAEISMRRAE